jgi:hypothetical protein
MPVEMLTFAELGERFKVSSQAARALTKRHRLPRSRSNDGKTLVQIDLTGLGHSPIARGTQAPGGDKVPSSGAGVWGFFRALAPISAACTSSSSVKSPLVRRTSASFARSINKAAGWAEWKSAS